MLFPKFTGVSATNIIDILYFKKCNNVEIFGGTIKGDKDEKLEAGADAAALGGGSACICLQSCDNIYIHDMTLTNSWGDAIYISPYGASAPACDHVLFENLYITNCLRNGMSICGVKNGIIRNCYIYNINGAMPKAGIDLEAEIGAANENILIEGCTIKNCEYQSVVRSRNTGDVTIKDCITNSAIRCGTNNIHDGVFKIINTTGNYLAVSGNVEIKDSTFTNWVYIETLNIDDTIYPTNFKAYNSKFYSTGNYGIVATGKSPAVSFERCTLTHLSNFEGNYIYHTCGQDYPSFTFKDCTFHLESSEYNLFGITPFKPLIIEGCTFIAETENMTHSFIGQLNAFEKSIFINNIIDMSKINNYTAKSVVAWYATTDCITFIENNIIKTNKNITNPLAETVFNCASMQADTYTYVANNLAPTFNNIAILPNANTAKFYEVNNIVSSSFDIQETPTETWIFTLDDKTTIEKKVVVL